MVDPIYTMGLAVLGLVLNALSCLAIAANDEFGWGLAMVAGIFWFLQLLGTLLLGSRETRGLAHVLVWVGAVFFLPLGIIGPLGARRYIRQAELEEEHGLL